MDMLFGPREKHFLSNTQILLFRNRAYLHHELILNMRGCVQEIANEPENQLLE